MATSCRPRMSVVNETRVPSGDQRGSVDSPSFPPRVSRRVVSPPDDATTWRSAFVPAAIAQEGDLLRVGRPPRPDRPLVRLGQLEDALALERRAENLEGPRAVPRERDLAAVRRKVDSAPDVIDVRHTRELLDREAP